LFHIGSSGIAVVDTRPLLREIPMTLHIQGIGGKRYPKIEEKQK
jgi:hypothetical protein